MNRGTVTLSKREQQRTHVLVQLLEGRLTAPDAARLLGVSTRHVRRLLRKVAQHGPAALAHGNRGRPSPRRLDEPTRARVLALARTTYAGVNDCQLTELLAERDALHVSRASVQRLLRAAGLGSPRTRRPPRHRQRPQAGLLVQMDGSHHPWLEDRGPRLVLLAAIDDATGEVLAAVFRPEEDAQGYFLLLRRLIRRYGVPCAAYTDRHGLFHRDARTPRTLAEQLAGGVASTQIGRALQDLGIRWIPASSPQGKGRIERFFGTFQDRFVTELRLAQARTLTEAQRVLDRFLPRFNARFRHPPAHSEPAWQAAPSPTELERICSFKYQRTVGHDNTIQLDGRLLQLHPGPAGRSYAGARVDVHAHLNGTLAVYYRGRRLAMTRLPQHSPVGPRPRLQHARNAQTTRPSPEPRPTQEPAIPAADHPWRRMITNDIWRERHRPKRDSFTEPLG
jgi:transposase